VVGPGLLHRVISEVQRRYIATRERPPASLNRRSAAAF
jgi:hypothetical protein